MVYDWMDFGVCSMCTEASLFSHGSSVEVTGPDGRTLLHQAAAAGFVECCSLLIRCGVPVNTMDNSIHK